MPTVPKAEIQPPRPKKNVITGCGQTNSQTETHTFLLILDLDNVVIFYRIIFQIGILNSLVNFYLFYLQAVSSKKKPRKKQKQKQNEDTKNRRVIQNFFVAV